MPKKKWIITGTTLLFLSIILFHFRITVINEQEKPIPATLELHISGNKLFSLSNKAERSFILPISKYTITVSSEGYDQQEIIIKNFNPFRKQIQRTIRLNASVIDISSLDTRDPTGTIKVSPFVSLVGTSILGQQVELEGVKKFLYGNYSAVLTDPHFTANISINGSTFHYKEQAVRSLKLDPGKNTRTLDEKDLEFVRNYLNDFLNFSSLDYIRIEPGFPQQFYLANKDMVLSLGDIMLLMCEKEVYESQADSHPVYFVPSNKKYTLVDRTFNVEDCYAHALTGYIPATINRTTTSNIVGPYEYWLHADNQLNQKIEKIPISFTFDIESGRYVNEENKGKSAISPCTNSITELALDKENRLCNNANTIGWFSPVTAHTYPDYPYPWVSGLKGTEEILTYPEKYGIPLTFYMVDSEVRVFDELSNINKRIQKYVDSGLIEIGSHTPHHTNLNSLDRESATRILARSKTFLEDTFNTSVTGMRGPYMSIVNRNIISHEHALQQAGYSYYAQQSYGEKGRKDIVSKPWSYVFLSEGKQQEFIEKIHNWEYVATLDHPWNYYYDEEEIRGEIYLKENPENAVEARAMVLLALSNGAIPMKFQEVEVDEK